ncbi:MAG: hypothetical protein PVF89_03140 [Lysobacterales bacterium]|jgi:hypothetical protein
MKPTVLLTIAIFLASAPAPDSRSIAEMSGGFLFAPDANALQAAETRPGSDSVAADQGDTGMTQPDPADTAKTARENGRPARRD